MTDRHPVPGYLPYGGATQPPNSGYAAGSDTSRERAARDDASGMTAVRQTATLRCLSRCREIGLTWRELAEIAGWHHGQASGVLSNLHKADRIARLTERRGRCAVYVLPEYVGDRETQPQGRPFTPCTDPACAQVEAMWMDAEVALRRVRRIHSQNADLLAPGRWCPACGHPDPCPTIRAIGEAH